MSLTFDEVTHTYQFNGIVVPSVTSILAPLQDFKHVPPHVLKAASEFGVAVHMACELDDLGELDESSLDVELRPYLKAWRKFCVDYEAEWMQIEQQVYHETLCYAGTLDRIGTVKGINTVLDIKSGSRLYPSVGPQLAAYQQAANHPTAQRMAVQLKSNGDYVARAYTDTNDWPLFCSLLTLRNWCATHSITPKFG